MLHCASTLNLQLLRKGIIRAFLAGVMLVMFCFSITPKFLLHRLLANHKDSPISNSTKAQLTSSGFHCDIENLVVEAPFLSNNINVNFHIPVVFASYRNKLTYNFTCRKNIISCLRGPPALS
jgi:hypothetical protein